MSGTDEKKIRKQYKELKKNWDDGSYSDYLRLRCFKGPIYYELEENWSESKEKINRVEKNIEKAENLEENNGEFIREQIDILRDIKGVGVTTASVILHLLDEEHFAIFDSNAFDGAGVDKSESDSKVENYIKYNEKVREKANKEDKELRNVEFKFFKKGRKS